jgi:hypothetical protein
MHYYSLSLSRDPSDRTPELLHPIYTLIPTMRYHTHNQISPQEQQAIVNGFKDAKAVQESGVRVAGNKFFVIQANDGSIYGKKQVGGLDVLCSPDHPISWSNSSIFYTPISK